jgi:hypothetical protein
MLSKLKTWWKRRKARKYWTAERQLENLRNMIYSDNRWLAHDKTADALTTRYCAALAPDWFRRVHADPEAFRREIGLEPKWTKAIHDEQCNRMAKWVRGYAPYTEGPLPETGWDQS